ncbi:hypothetical protein Y032_0130g1532 [Ancylostoma ceylanicum]|uniref:Uncharacterized protein n=1 Tax=Ancylostoma ceylanicum TaxID=53326 RepID=A0A016T7I7_9BILA|nr:hypothetical protein Y032_0130g1532 [Ancylostoma ceylanicum]
MMPFNSRLYLLFYRMEYDPPIRQSATSYRLTSIGANIASNLSLVRNTPFIGHRDNYPLGSLHMQGRISIDASSQQQASLSIAIRKTLKCSRWSDRSHWECSTFLRRTWPN